MSVLSRSHLSDPALLTILAEDLAREQGACAQVLMDLAEVDARRLYLPAGYPSMFDYCVRELRFPREKAFKRIRAARAARRFPAIFELLAAGRLSLSAIVMLAAHLTEHTARELLGAAADHTVDEIEHLLVARFPRPDLPARIVPVVVPEPPVSAAPQAPLAIVLGAQHEASGTTPPGTISDSELSLRTVWVATPESAGVISGNSLSSRTVEPAAPRPRVIPLAPERFALQCTVSRQTHENLRKAQALLRHQVPDGNLEAILDRALELLVHELEKRRCAATGRPRVATRPNAAGPDPNPRHIPAAVRRAVWTRDRGQCTFRSESGRRCEARGHLEVDHIEPVARGGRASVGNLRLRCRAHNQYEAERMYGAEFMRHKREAARTTAGVADGVLPATATTPAAPGSRPRSR